MIRDDLKKIYDRFADTYDQNRALFDMSDVIACLHHRLPETTGRLLDLGCGAGEPFPAYFIRQGWQVTGVDFSSRMLALAHHYQPELRTILADMSEVDFPDGAFDAVTAIYCLFHMEHQKHGDLFKKIHRWLRPDGRFLFTYATKEYTGAETFNGFKEFMGERLFYSHTTPDALYATLRTIGFTIDEARYREIGGETFLWVTVAKSQEE